MAFLAPPPLTTPDFVLRSFLPGDGERLAEALRTSYNHLSATMTWPVPDPSVHVEEEKVRRYHARFLAGEDFPIAVLAPGADLLLGATGFHLRGAPITDRAAEISMWIRESHARKGLGTKVLRTMLRWGFGPWHFERISWLCSVSNIGSRRAAEKAGLHYEGTLRGFVRRSDGTREDMRCYARLASDEDARETASSGLL